MGESVHPCPTPSLDSQFLVDSGTVPAAFPDKGSYNCASETSKGVARGPSDSVQEASWLLRAAIEHPTGSTAALQRAARGEADRVDPRRYQAPAMPNPQPPRTQAGKRNGRVQGETW